MSRSTAVSPRPLRRAAILCCALLLAACGSSSAPDLAGGSSGGSGNLGACTTDVATDATLLAALLPSAATVESRQRAADQFGEGFRIAGNDAEIGYIHHLSDQLRALGAVDVVEEPYTFNAWTPQSPSLAVVDGPAPGPLPVAYFVPNSGSTGPNGLTAPVVYLSALSDVNLVSAIYAALVQQNPGNVLLAVQAALADATSGGVSLAQALASANVAGKIVLYDAPRTAVPLAVFEAVSQYVNNSSGTTGPQTPYARPFIDELVLLGAIDLAIKNAGAAGIVAVLDYPAVAADNSYVPFGGLAIPSAPALYLDRDTGAALKSRITAAGASPVTLKLTLDAATAQATSYNVSGLIPGACKTEIVVSSHSDGPNSIEDNGPAAILSIADYFAHAPASQRQRGLRIVFSGGHFEGSPGLNAYIARHQADLTAAALGVIEIEHLGAREWEQLTPGTMALDGLPEPLVLYANPGSVLQDENIKFAQQFDRSIVTLPLPFGEGGAWSSSANLPKTQIISGPTYLLNGPLPQVSDQFTDYQLEQRQISALVQMVLDLNTHTDSELLANDVPVP